MRNVSLKLKRIPISAALRLGIDVPAAAQVYISHYPLGRFVIVRLLARPQRDAWYVEDRATGAFDYFWRRPECLRWIRLWCVWFAPQRFDGTGHIGIDDRALGGSGGPFPGILEGTARAIGRSGRFLVFRCHVPTSTLSAAGSADEAAECVLLDRVTGQAWKRKRDGLDADLDADVEVLEEMAAQVPLDFGKRCEPEVPEVPDEWRQPIRRSARVGAVGRAAVQRQRQQRVGAHRR